ncbi:MAG: hypothetical protein M3071_04560 [Actinomycetota bacterium]|nr:hypothetical protein [Actinomycetota bacterium]
MEVADLAGLPAGVGVCDRGAQGGIAGEGQLSSDRPDSVAVVGCGFGRGLHEGCLRQTGLAGEGEHRGAVETLGVVYDGECVAC